MVELKNVTQAMLTRVVEADNRQNEQSMRDVDDVVAGRKPWPEEWHAAKELVANNDAVLEWMSDCIGTVNKNGGDVCIGPMLCRAIILGYNLAKEQLSVELERVVN